MKTYIVRIIETYEYEVPAGNADEARNEADKLHAQAGIDGSIELLDSRNLIIAEIY